MPSKRELEKENEELRAQLAMLGGITPGRARLHRELPSQYPLPRRHGLPRGFLHRHPGAVPLPHPFSSRERMAMKNNEFRYSDEEFEYRASDSGLGVVSGVIVRYGDVAKVGMGLTEQVERGAFTMGQWWANRMHQRPAILGITGENLTLIEDNEALRFRLGTAIYPAGQGDRLRTGQGLSAGGQRGTGDGNGEIPRGASVRHQIDGSPLRPGGRSCLPGLQTPVEPLGRRRDRIHPPVFLAG